MRSQQEIKAELLAAQKQLNKASKQVLDLERELTDAASVAWISANGVTMDQIQLSSGEDVPFFGLACNFAEWLKQTGCEKRFCEWNEEIYHTAEFIQNGGPYFDSPGRMRK